MARQIPLPTLFSDWKNWGVALVESLRPQEIQAVVRWQALVADYWLTAPGITPPVPTVFAGAISAPYFPDAVTTGLRFQARIPAEYEEGTSVVPFVAWFPVTGAAGNVRWSMEYVWGEKGAALPAPATLIATVAAEGGAGVALRHSVTEFPLVAGAGHKYGSVLTGVLSRTGGHADDTMASDGALLAIGFYHRVDVLGARTARVKGPQV